MLHCSKMAANRHSPRCRRGAFGGHRCDVAKGHYGGCAAVDGDDCLQCWSPKDPPQKCLIRPGASGCSPAKKGCCNLTTHPLRLVLALLGGVYLRQRKQLVLATNRLGKQAILATLFMWLECMFNSPLGGFSVKYYITNTATFLKGALFTR